MGRRPHSVPMWNDIYHRRGARAVRATSMAVSWGVMMTAISWMITSALLPKTNAPTTRVIDGGLVIDKWPGTWRCSERLTLLALDSGKPRYVCACPRGDCVRGYSDSILPGQRVDLEVSENWAGTIVVGLVAHGI